ncbi:hypothetical protein [Vibrio phage vB_ValP_FGH]|nr:hypothetical protein [Vibrio phage vB_ValP_FGH]
MPNKKRKCLHCKEFSNAEEGIRVPAGFFCSLDHATKYAKAKQERARERQQQKAKAEQRKTEKATRAASRDAKRRDLKWQHKLTQKAFNRMRVLEELLWFKQRGLEPECISCGRPLGGDQWCCGHFKTRGAQSGLRYDPKNTYIQHNHRCNMNLSGDIDGTKTTRGYKQGLKDRFGEEEGQAIIDYCESNTAPVKWSWEELEKNRALYNARIRELEAML